MPQRGASAFSRTRRWRRQVAKGRGSAHKQYRTHSHQRGAACVGAPATAISARPGPRRGGRKQPRDCGAPARRPAFHPGHPSATTHAGRWHALLQATAVRHPLSAGRQLRGMEHRQAIALRRAARVHAAAGHQRGHRSPHFPELPARRAGTQFAAGHAGAGPRDGAGAAAGPARTAVPRPHRHFRRLPGPPPAHPRRDHGHPVPRDRLSGLHAGQPHGAAEHRPRRVDGAAGTGPGHPLRPADPPERARAEIRLRAHFRAHGSGLPLRAHGGHGAGTVHARAAADHPRAGRRGQPDRAAHPFGGHAGPAQRALGVRVTQVAAVHLSGRDGKAPQLLLRRARVDPVPVGIAGTSQPGTFHRHGALGHARRLRPPRLRGGLPPQSGTGTLLGHGHRGAVRQFRPESPGHHAGRPLAHEPGLLHQLCAGHLQ